MSSPKLRAIFRPKSKIQTIFSPKVRCSQKKKKKKVFTKIESDFSAGFVTFRLVGGMHLEMEPNYSKWRLFFRPKSLLLGWWGDMHPPHPPPLNPPLIVRSKFNPHPGHVVASLDKAFYDNYLCIVASNKQQIQWAIIRKNSQEHWKLLSWCGFVQARSTVIAIKSVRIVQ